MIFKIQNFMKIIDLVIVRFAWKIDSKILRITNFINLIYKFEKINFQISIMKFSIIINHKLLNLFVIINAKIIINVYLQFNFDRSIFWNEISHNYIWYVKFYIEYKYI